MFDESFKTSYGVSKLIVECNIAGYVFILSINFSVMNLHINCLMKFMNLMDQFLHCT